MADEGFVVMLIFTLEGVARAKLNAQTFTAAQPDLHYDHQDSSIRAGDPAPARWVKLSSLPAGRPAGLICAGDLGVFLVGSFIGPVDMWRLGVTLWPSPESARRSGSAWMGDHTGLQLHNTISCCMIHTIFPLHTIAYDTGSPCKSPDTYFFAPTKGLHQCRQPRRTSGYFTCKASTGGCSPPHARLSLNIVVIASVAYQNHGMILTCCIQGLKTNWFLTPI